MVGDQGAEQYRDDDESYLGSEKGKKFATDVHGLLFDYFYSPNPDDSREQSERVHDSLRLAGEFPVDQFFLDGVDQVVALPAGVDVVYFPVYVHAGHPGEVQTRFRGGDDCRDGLPDYSMVLLAFPNRDEFLQCHIRYVGSVALVAGVVAVELERGAVGDGVVLYFSEQAFYV